MEESLKFNSQVCTTKEQSQRLLEMGLKPETADMSLSVVCGEEFCQWVGKVNNMGNIQVNGITVPAEQVENIPAWSLHRLLLLCDVTAMFTRDTLETAYDDQINAIENLIKNGYFNKEYLKQ